MVNIRLQYDFQTEKSERVLFLILMVQQETTPNFCRKTVES